MIWLHVRWSAEFGHPVAPSILTDGAFCLTNNVIVIPKVGVDMVPKLSGQGMQKCTCEVLRNGLRILCVCIFLNPSYIQQMYVNAMGMYTLGLPSMRPCSHHVLASVFGVLKMSADATEPCLPMPHLVSNSSAWRFAPLVASLAASAALRALAIASALRLCLGVRTLLLERDQRIICVQGHVDSVESNVYVRI